jgi:hypothetical protein
MGLIAVLRALGNWRRRLSTNPPRSERRAKRAAIADCPAIPGIPPVNQGARLLKLSAETFRRNARNDIRC